MFKKYLLSILVLAGLVSFSFTPAFADLISDDEQNHISEGSFVEEEEKAEVNPDEGYTTNNEENQEENHEEDHDENQEVNHEEDVFENEKKVRSTCPFCILV